MVSCRNNRSISKRNSSVTLKFKTTVKALPHWHMPVFPPYLACLGEDGSCTLTNQGGAGGHQLDQLPSNHLSWNIALEGARPDW